MHLYFPLPRLTSETTKELYALKPSPPLNRAYLHTTQNSSNKNLCPSQGARRENPERQRKEILSSGFSSLQLPLPKPNPLARESSSEPLQPPAAAAHTQTPLGLGSEASLRSAAAVPLCAAQHFNFFY